MSKARDNRVWILDAYTYALGESDAAGRVQARQIAGAGVRCLAGVFDCAVQALLGAGLYFGVMHLRPDFLAAYKVQWWMLPIAALEWHVIYFLLFEAFTWGRTPGKALLKLRVVDFRALGRPTSFQLLTRNLVRLVDWLPLHYIVGLVSTLASPTRQRLGDRLGRTVVVYQESILEQLTASGVPDSNYSTSDDGYLLEAFLGRYDALEKGQRDFLARDLARYFNRKYNPEDAIVQRLFFLEKWHEYLVELCQMEKRAATGETA